MNDATADSTAGRRARYAKHLPADGDNTRVKWATPAQAAPLRPWWGR